MKIKGFQGTSLLDYPGRIASLVFFGGCNLTCPYCHNPGLVLHPEEFDDYPLEALVEDLQERRAFIDGVVVTGGEPTLDRDILSFLRELKSLDLLVKLDTNGLLPGVLQNILSENLADHIALDIKTSPARYGELHSAPVDFVRLEKTIDLLAESRVEYEIRTTCVPGLVEKTDIRKIGELIRCAPLWALQQFVPGHAMDENLQEMEPHTPEKIRAFAEIAGEYVDEVVVRGI